jgi:hypothetical protein
VTPRVSELLAELVRFPTQQAGADGKAGNERALCEFLLPLLRERHADEVVFGTAPRGGQRRCVCVFARWGTPPRDQRTSIPCPRMPNGRATRGRRIQDGGSVVSVPPMPEGIGNARRTDSAQPRVRVLFSGDEEAAAASARVRLNTHATSARRLSPAHRTRRRIASRRARAEASLLPGGHSSADPRSVVKLARLATGLDDIALRRLHDGPSGRTGTCLNI